MAVLTLNYADGFSETKSMNTTGQFAIVLSSDGISYDLARAKNAAIKIGNAQGYVTDIPVDLDAIEDKAQGTINIKLDDNFMAQFPPDVYYLEVWVDTDNGRQIFPSEGVLPFTIDRNIMSNIDGVAKVTLFQFQENFNDLKKMIMDNQAFLDTKLRQELEDQTNIKNDFANTVDTKQKNFDNDLSDARQNIEDKKNDAHSYVDQITNNSKSDVDNKTTQAKNYIDTVANDNTNSLKQTASNAKGDLVQYSSDRKDDVNNTVNNAKTDLTNFSQARQDEINKRVEELKNTITTQQNQYQQNIDNMNSDINSNKASYQNLHDETKSLLNQLEANENKVHASVEDIQDAKYGAQTKADNAQDQAVQQSSQYTDKKYNDLLDKNNILSSQLSDSQKPNLVDLNMNSWLNTGNNANATMFQVNNIHFEAGKSYWFSLQYQDGSWKDTNPSMMFYKNDWDSFNGDYWILSYDPSHNKNTLNPIFHYVPQQDETVNIRLTRWSSTNEPIYIRGFTITQTDNYLPFEQAEINRKAWQSASQTDLDNAKSDFTNKTNDLSSKVDENFKKDNARMDYLGATKYDKSETYNKGEVDNKTDNLSSRIDDTNKTLNDTINNKIDNGVSKSIEQASQDSKQRISDLQSKYFGEGTITNGNNLDGYTWNGSFALGGVSLSALGGNTGLPQNYTGFYGVLKVDTYSGFTRQFLYDNVGNQWYRYLGNGTPWRQVPTADDIASITKNAWRELKLENGLTGTVLCKPDFDNKRVRIIANIDSNSNTSYVAFSYSGPFNHPAIFSNPMNDFDFVNTSSFWMSTRTSYINGGTGVGKFLGIGNSFCIDGISGTDNLRNLYHTMSDGYLPIQPK